MKKFGACLCFLVLAVSCEAYSMELPETRFAFRSKRIVRKNRVKIDRSERWQTLAKSLSDLAQRIAAHNKFIYETKFTKKERAVDEDNPTGLVDEYEKGFADQLYNRVWAKDKTLVIGCEDIDEPGNNYAYYINTSDPLIYFAGNIRAGADIGLIEKFFGASVKSLSDKDGEITLLPESDWGECVRIQYKDNKITELEWYFNDTTRPSVERTAKVVRDKKSEMGLSSWEMLDSRY